jgi:hypothetical protein
LNEENERLKRLVAGRSVQIQILKKVVYLSDKRPVVKLVIETELAWFRLLTLMDEYTRECLAVHVDWSIRAVDVIDI